MDKKAWRRAALHKIETMPREEFLAAVRSSGLELIEESDGCESVSVLFRSDQQERKE